MGWLAWKILELQTLTCTISDSLAPTDSQNCHDTMTVAMDPEKRRKLSLVLQRLYLMKAPKAWAMGERTFS